MGKKSKQSSETSTGSVEPIPAVVDLAISFAATTFFVLIMVVVYLSWALIAYDSGDYSTYKEQIITAFALSLGGVLFFLILVYFEVKESIQGVRGFKNRALYIFCFLLLVGLCVALGWAINKYNAKDTNLREPVYIALGVSAGLVLLLLVAFLASRKSSSSVPRKR